MPREGNIPNISGSTLYDKNTHLFYQQQIIGGYHEGETSKQHARIKILPTGWLNNDDATYQRILFEDDSNTYGTKPGWTNHELYKAVDIPHGWKAVSYRVNSSQNRAVSFVVVSLENGSGATDSQAGNANSNITLATPYISANNTYALIKYDPSSTADIIYGGWIECVRL